MEKHHTQHTQLWYIEYMHNVAYVVGYTHIQYISKTTGNSSQCDAISYKNATS